MRLGNIGGWKAFLWAESDSRGGLAQEGVLVEAVGGVAVEGAGLHGHAPDGAVRLLRQVEGLQHPEAWGDRK